MFIGASSAVAVFPTPVGVFPPPRDRPSRLLRLPHARGGVSFMKSASCLFPWSSPRPWGCFCRSAAVHRRRVVFPTPVGVFPVQAGWRAAHPRLPHARGGVSAVCGELASSTLSSPRPWGCFQKLCRLGANLQVFPTPTSLQKSCRAARAGAAGSSFQHRQPAASHSDRQHPGSLPGRALASADRQHGPQDWRQGGVEGQKAWCRVPPPGLTQGSSGH